MDINQAVSLIMMNQDHFLSDRFGNRSREQAAKHYLRKQREMRMRSDRSRANALRQDIRYLPEIGVATRLSADTSVRVRRSLVPSRINFRPMQHGGLCYIDLAF